MTTAAIKGWFLENCLALPNVQQPMWETLNHDGFMSRRPLENAT